MLPFEERELNRGEGACNDARSGMDFFARSIEVGDERVGEPDTADVGVRYEDWARERVCEA